MLCPGWWGVFGSSTLCRDFQNTPDVTYSCCRFYPQHGVYISHKLQLTGPSWQKWERPVQHLSVSWYMTWDELDTCQSRILGWGNKSPLKTRTFYFIEVHFAFFLILSHPLPLSNKSQNKCFVILLNVSSVPLEQSDLGKTMFLRVEKIMINVSLKNSKKPHHECGCQYSKIAHKIDDLTS